jgi:quinol monooxygenase YgiN
MMKCTVIVTLTPLPNLADAVMEAVRVELPEIRQAEGCESYEMYRRVDDVVVLIETWSSRLTWQNHFDTAAIGRLRDTLTPLLAVPAERWETYPAG